MTRTANLDALTISLDGPAPEQQEASAEQSALPTTGSAMPRSIDNDLVAELESALQAVLTREPRPQSPEPTRSTAAAPANAVLQGEAPPAVTQEAPIAAAEAAPPPYVALRPAAVPEPAEAPAWELETAADGHRAVPPAPRRWGLPLRAALAVTGVLGLAGAGGVGLMFAAAPDGEPAPLLAKPVRTETIRAPVAPDSELIAAKPDAEDSTGGPTRAAAIDAPASEVTLLRPVGAEPRVAAVQPAERSPLVREQSRTGADSIARQIVKAPDRLVESPPPAEPTNELSGAAPQGSIGSEAPTESSEERAAERLSDDPAAAGQGMVATMETPFGAEAMVAEPGIAGEETASEADAPGGTAEAEAAGEPTRSASVTSAVNMRAGPDNDAAVLKVVPAGSEVGIIACESWCQVVFAGERGWIYKSFVSGADS